MARDYTKYTVEGLGEDLNKRKLVFTVVKDYVEKNNPTFWECGFDSRLRYKSLLNEN